MVARGNSDPVVTSVTAAPAIVEVTHLSATRHWQDNGKTIIRCRFHIYKYTTLLVNYHHTCVVYQKFETGTIKEY